MSKKYWLVGATWSDEDMFNTFINRGYWEMGYSDRDQPLFADRRRQMKEGDRIAIESMLGQGEENIKIRAIGIINTLMEKTVVYTLNGFLQRCPV